MSFALRRGRPRNITNTSQDQELQRRNLSRSADADVLQSLFLLKKITAEQNESAKFYQKLRIQYHSSIDSPCMRTSSILQIGNLHSNTRHHPTRRDEILFAAWNEIKAELHKTDQACEEILYKVLIENKMKYELINPTSFIRNSLRILQIGLDCITKYRNKPNQLSL